jgi:conjugative transfer region protein TrbK
MTEERAAAASAKRAGRRIPLRVLAIAVAIPIAGFAAMIGLRSPAGEESRYAIGDSGPERAERPVDPLKAELERCRTVTAETVDERCRAAWEINRRRFFGESRSLVLPPAQAPAATETQEGR